ncbi:MAG: hypothetical protein OEM04_08920 [Flavobacteriaceae bacterium]|nr:hypothetical protein [Flavobacteriaceae bacterium]
MTLDNFKKPIIGLGYFTVTSSGTQESMKAAASELTQMNAYKTY